METTELSALTASRFWQKHYPKGTPLNINPDQYSSILALLEEAFTQYPNQPAFALMDKKMTYAELDRLSRDFAGYLQSLGLQPGDRIAIQLPNILQYPVAMYGALRAGLVVVNTNPLYTSREMQHQFKDSGAKALVILDRFAVNLESIIAQTDLQHVVITGVGDLLGFPKKQLVNFVLRTVKKTVPAYNLPKAVSLDEALSRGRKHGFKPVQAKGSDIAFIQYTGGTTGVSKGAMLTHRNIIANVEMNYAWMKAGLHGDPYTIITALPLYHVYSLTVNCLSALRCGGFNILIPNARDLPAMIKEMKKYPFTLITAVNTLYNGLLNHPDIKTVNFSTLRIASAGGMALQSSVAERWRELTGVLPAEGYGLSETSPVLTCNPVDGTGKLGSIGLGFPNTDIKIVKEDGTEANLNEAGELWAKGPQVMPGYWQRPDETAKVMEDGWFKTGDIATLDEDGYFRIVDRKKDMISVSGLKVFPNEIEEVLARHPGVLEVAAIGIPDATTGEAVKIFIVKKDANLTEEDVRRYCVENFTNYKRPKLVEFRTELPKSNVGKILRRMLKDEAPVTA